ncbi:MAG: Fur family transcriptional regulator [Candidatus Dojkabacteria bacterium]
MKNSKKRNKILELFSKGYLLTASEVVEKVNNVDRATIYRNLTRFVEQGLLREVNVRKGISSYELNTDHHQHFICSNCEKVVPVEVDASILKEIIPNGVKLEDFELNLRGKCEDCK